MLLRSGLGSLVPCGDICAADVRNTELLHLLLQTPNFRGPGDGFLIELFVKGVKLLSLPVLGLVHFAQGSP